MNKTSIIIPVYNKQDYLHSCLESALKQNNAEVEILCINDGSTDASESILRQYEAEGKIRLFSTENHGISAARNLGLQEAAGEYIVFLDADDRLPEDAVSIHLAGMAENNADIVSGRHEAYDSGVLFDQDPEPDHKFADGTSMLELCLHDFGTTHHVWATMFRRAFIEGIRFDEQATVHEDSHFMFECALRKPRYQMIDEIVYCYTRDQNSLSHSGFSRRKAEDILRLAEAEYRMVKELYPQYLPLAENLVIKAEMAVLANCPEKDIEKECLRRIMEKKQYFVPEMKFDSQLFALVTHRCYWLYKLIHRIRFPEKH